MKEEIRGKDPTGSGFIDPDVLYAILVKKCIPLTFQDFRFLTQQVFIGMIQMRRHGITSCMYLHVCMYVCVSQLKKGPGGIAYNHFLQAYNPTHAHHELDGASLSRSTLLLPNNFNQGQSVSFSDDISMGTSAFAGDLKRVWHDVLKECHRADPERNGQVSKATFIDALQKADAAKVRDHYYCLGHK